MKRGGKELATIAKGDKRRLSDGRNAWRKMTPRQRREFLNWIAAEEHKVERPRSKAALRGVPLNLRDEAWEHAMQLYI